VTALMLGASVSAHAATIQITMENLVISPAEASAKVGDTIEWINKDIFVHTATARNGELGGDDAAEEDRHPGFEEGRPDRLLLPLSSEHEGDPRSRAMRPLERSEMGS
jgi:plastocyanin